MKNSFLNYYKTILDKVSFDHNLFRKEYQKAMNVLDADEAGNLRHWLRSKGLPEAWRENPGMGNENPVRFL